MSFILTQTGKAWLKNWVLKRKKLFFSLLSFPSFSLRHFQPHLFVFASHLFPAGFLWIHYLCTDYEWLAGISRLWLSLLRVLFSLFDSGIFLQMAVRWANLGMNFVCVNVEGDKNSGRKEANLRIWARFTFDNRIQSAWCLSMEDNSMIVWWEEKSFNRS